MMRRRRTMPVAPDLPRSADLARLGDLLRLILSSPGNPARHPRRYHTLPTEAWVTPIARNAVDDTSGALRSYQYVLPDRDAKFCSAFDNLLASEGLECLRLPPRSPNLNAFAERWVRSVKEECLSKLILFGERSPYRALTEFVAHYHAERNHQGRADTLLFPGPIRNTRRLLGTTAGPLEYFDPTTIEATWRCRAEAVLAHLADRRPTL